jgi:hypothetical protein
MKTFWKKLRSYYREVIFFRRISPNWRNCILLLKSAFRFHLSNAIGKAPDLNSTVFVTCDLGAHRDVRLALRSNAGDMFVLFEVFLGRD